MAMLRVCGHPGCGTLTLGELCIDHEQTPAPHAGRPRMRAVPARANAPRVKRRDESSDGRRSGA